MKRFLLFALLAGVAVIVSPRAASATTASNPSCTFSTTWLMGGTEAICSNPNASASTAANTILCYTEDGTPPASNGSGTGCTTGIALAPVLATLSAYSGYFNFNQSVTVKILAGVSGETDSSVVSYTRTVGTQAISTYNFGWQCGTGQTKNCPFTGGSPDGTVAWPTSPAMPSVLRLHDSSWEWAIVNTASNTYVWGRPDAYLDGIASHPGTIGVMQFTSIPCWTITSPPNYTCPDSDSIYGNNTNIPPTDLGTGPYGSSPSFNTFVSTLLAHTSGKGNSVASNIQVFNLFNEWNLCVHWAGTPQQLYQLIQYPAQLIRAALPNAVIISPSTTGGSGGVNCQSGNWVTDATTWMDLENTNGRLGDIIAYHEYLTTGANTITPPETIWNTVIGAYLTAQAGIAGWKVTPWINDETNFDAGEYYSCPALSSWSTADCTGMIARHQILHDSNGAVGLYWYYGNWTFVNCGGTECSSAAPVSYATLYEYLQTYLTGGHFTGAAANVGGTIWTAPFVESSGVAALWVWTTSETAGQTAIVPAGYTDYKDLFGNITPVVAGASAPITVEPVMLEQIATVSASPAELLPGLGIH